MKKFFSLDSKLVMCNKAKVNRVHLAEMSRIMKIKNKGRFEAVILEAA